MARYGFNPRAREGRDDTSEPVNRRNDCFNPRAREGRDPASSHLVPPQGFNPRAREGRDLLPLLISYRAQIVSIHAPARGATPKPS